MTVFLIVIKSILRLDAVGGSLRLSKYLTEVFPGGSDGETSACNARDLGPISGWGRSPGEKNGYPLQYSCLENLMDRGAWWATAHREAKSQTRPSD